MLKIHFCEITYKRRNILSRSELLINTKLNKFFDHKAKKSRWSEGKLKLNIIKTWSKWEYEHSLSSVPSLAYLINTYVSCDRVYRTSWGYCDFRTHGHSISQSTHSIAHRLPIRGDDELAPLFLWWMKLVLLQPQIHMSLPSWN